MPRPVWKGSLKLSLIAIPVRVFAATTASADVHFRQLHRKCHTPIQLKKWCPHCEQAVESDEVVKGYESAKGEYVVVEAGEIEELRPEATHVIDIVQTMHASAIDPTYIERVYYLAPESKASGSPFAVIREALGELAGVGSLALHGREYVVAVVPRGEAITLYTLRTKGEVHGLDDISEVEFAHVKVKAEEVKLARQIVGSFQETADLSTLTDHYQESLKRMIAAKTPETINAAPSPVGRGRKAPVVNLMDALRQSLAHVQDAKRQPRAGRHRPAKVLVHRPTRRRKAG